MSPIIYWIERSFKSRHISRGLVLIRGLMEYLFIWGFGLRFDRDLPLKKYLNVWALHTKVKYVRNLTIYFFAVFFASFLAHYAATTEEWNELWHCLCGKTKITPLSPCFLFSEWETFLWYLDSPRATYLTQKLSVVSIQIVFEQKYSFLHDVYLTNIWIMLLLHFFLMQLQIKLHILCSNFEP